MSTKPNDPPFQYWLICVWPALTDPTTRAVRPPRPPAPEILAVSHDLAELRAKAETVARDDFGQRQRRTLIIASAREVLVAELQVATRWQAKA